MHGEPYFVVEGKITERPSIGSRIIGNDEGFATSIAGLLFVQKKISSEPESNNIRGKITSDIIKYIDDILSLWEEVDEKSILIENTLSIIGKGYIRIMFAYHNAKKSALYKQIKAVWPPYERCLCWSRDSHFKFCCGDEQNWLKMFPI